MKIYAYHGKKNVSGEKIRQVRHMKRMSQSALAAKMQVEGGWSVTASAGLKAESVLWQIKNCRCLQRFWEWM